MAVLLPNINMDETVENMALPVKPGGETYLFEMICDSGKNRLYADTSDELIDHLIPGFLALDSLEQISARIRHSVDIQVGLQSFFNLEFDDVPRTENENEILFGPRHIQPSMDEWVCDVPLVLVDAFYAPYTETLKPLSSYGDVLYPENMWWLRPNEGNLEYLRSLHECHIIGLNISNDGAI